MWALQRSPVGARGVRGAGQPGHRRAARSCFPIDAADPAAVAQLADDLDVDLVVVGPEVPLVAGVADAVRARGRLAFGPGAAGARLEGSKAWMKQVLADAGVPTARHATFGADDEPTALAFLDEFARPLRGEDRRPRRGQGRRRHRVARRRARRGARLPARARRSATPAARS